MCRFTEAVVVFVLKTLKLRELGDQNVLVFKTWPKRARWLLELPEDGGYFLAPRQKNLQNQALKKL